MSSRSEPSASFDSTMEEKIARIVAASEARLQTRLEQRLTELEQKLSAARGGHGGRRPAAGEKHGESCDIACSQVGMQAGSRFSSGKGVSSASHGDGPMASVLDAIGAGIVGGAKPSGRASSSTDAAQASLECPRPPAASVARSTAQFFSELASQVPPSMPPSHDGSFVSHDAPW